MSHHTDCRQRGSASLLVVMVLLLSMALVVAYANRSLLFEQRASINQYRATQAFEAAEAGLEWATAMLNDPRSLDADCLPAASGTSLRQRWLGLDAGSLQQLPRTWSNAGTAVPLQAACARDASGWSCSCPAGGHPGVDTAVAVQATAAFVVHAEPMNPPGMVRLVATGCTGAGGACAPGGATAVEASATVQAVFALVPALASRPVAPLTARQDIDAGGAALGLHNADAASGGIVAHAGGRVLGSQLRAGTVAGASASLAVVEADPALAASDADHFFTGFFGLDKATWRAQPAVRRVRCAGDCSAAVATAIADAVGPALVWVDGDLTLRGPLPLGTAAQPVVIVSSGIATLDGAVAIHGVLYAAAITWNDTTSAGGLVRGALVSEGGYSGNAASDLIYDAALLRTLQYDAGSFVRLPGSWRDF